MRTASWPRRRGDFDEAFNRWRDLFAAAEEQRDAARRTMDDYSASYRDKRAAQTRHAQAVDQLNLLQRGTTATIKRFLHVPLPRHRGLPARLQLPAAASARVRPGEPRWSRTADVPPASALPCACRVRPAQPRLPRGARLPRRASAALARSPGVGDTRRATAHPRGANLHELRRRTFRRRPVDVPRLRRVARQRRGGRQHVPDRKRRHLSGGAHHRERRRAPAPGVRPSDDVRVGDSRPGDRRAPRVGLRCGRRDRAHGVRPRSDHHAPQQGAAPQSRQEGPRLPHRSGVGVLGQERGGRGGRGTVTRPHGVAPSVDRPKRAGPEECVALPARRQLSSPRSR